MLYENMLRLLGYWVNNFKTVFIFSEDDPNGIHDWSATGNPVMMWVQTLHTLFSSFINALLYRIFFSCIIREGDSVIDSPYVG